MEKEKAEIARLVEKYGRDQSLMKYVNSDTLKESYYCNATIKKIVAEAEANHRFPCIGGTLPQNNIRFLREFKELIEEKSAEKTLIIDMALTMTECKVNLYDSLEKEGQSIKHFILTADEKL